MQNMSGGKTALGLDTGIGVLLCYFGNLACGLPLGVIYSILVIVQDKTNKVVRFHAIQALLYPVLLIILCIPLGIGYAVGAMIDVAIFGYPLVFTGIIGLVGLVVFIGLFYFVIMSAIKGYGGEIYKIPIVGNFAEKFANG